MANLQYNITVEQKNKNKKWPQVCCAFHKNTLMLKKKKTVFFYK